jgi:hypothetical protein
VSTRDLGGAVEIRIRDNGIGIPPEIKDKLFQPFFRITAADLVENGDRPQARNAFEQGHHLAVPNRGQRLAPARRSLLRREPEVLLNAIGGGGTEPGLGRSNTRRLGLAETHLQPHLAVDDVAAGQGAVSSSA